MSEPRLQSTPPAGSRSRLAPRGPMSTGLRPAAILDDRDLLARGPVALAERPRPPADEDGSLVTEYGLLAVVAATVAGVVIAWASNGALVTLFNALLRHARSLVGA